VTQYADALAEGLAAEEAATLGDCTFVGDLEVSPVVGERYLVDCVWGRVCDCASQRETWLPVTGPRHEDSEVIKFKWWHQHYDLRFLQPALYDHLVVRTSHALYAVLVDESVPAPRETSRRVLRCLRSQLDFPGDASFAQALERAYAGACLRPCRVCPHRGLPLGSAPVVGGVVECPGHGLRWDVATGRLSPRGATP